jgi:PBSX family phage terminase large subunit
VAAAKVKIRTEQEALAILAEVARLAKEPALKLVDDNFPKQAAFIRSKAHRKAALCTRRAGKSFGIGLALYKAAIENPGASCLYLALTRDSARKIMWKDVVKVIDKQLHLGCSFNETLLTVTMPNGSVIYLAGADATKEEMEKFLGGKYALIVIDEAGSFRQDLRKLVYENLEPAVADYDGTVVLIGTPTSLTRGLFFDVTQPSKDKREPGWDVHEWDTFDNPYMEAKWRKRVERMIELNPKVVETPFYRRMYRKEWVLDDDELCYKYAPGRNDCAALPTGRRWHYVLGVDLGFSPDPSAFVVAAFSAEHNELYFVEAYKATGMDVTDVALRIHDYQRRFAIYKTVIDNATKQAVEEMKNRHGLALEAADKVGKAEFIELMSDEIKRGCIKVVHPEAAGLADEWSDLIWDEAEKKKTGKKQEHPACDNHMADAALYSWRHCYQYLAPKGAPPKKQTDTDRVEAWEEEQGALLEAETQKPFWERDFRDFT